MRRVVVTGGPGSGKTSLIEALAAAGFRVRPEAGRAIIRRQRAIDGLALPWRDRALFAELMLDHDIAAHAFPTGHETVFHDRGIVDAIGYLELSGLSVPAHFERAAHQLRYHSLVFIAPVWPEIFGPDAERRQSLDEARRTHAAMVTAYARHGYVLADLPRASVEARTAFVLEQLETGQT